MNFPILWIHLINRLGLKVKIWVEEDSNLVLLHSHNNKHVDSNKNKQIWSWWVLFWISDYLKCISINLYLGLVIYNWHGDNPYGLHLEIGDTVQILEQCCGEYILIIIYVSEYILKLFCVSYRLVQRICH